MSEFVDTLLVFVVLAFFGFLTWSMIKKQSMAQTFKEFKDLVMAVREKEQ